MDSVKDLVELLGKAKNIRLNVSIFFVSFVVLFCVDKNLIKIGEVLETTLKGLVFVVSIRIVYWVFGFAIDVFNERRDKKAAELAEIGLVEQRKLFAESERENALKEKAARIESLRFVFEGLDVFQMYYVQELKRQNHVTISKGAELFSLKGKQIVRAISVGPGSESVSFTHEAENLLNQELWQKFDELKKISLVRFFEGLQPGAMEHFEGFVKKDSIDTRNYRGSSFSYFSNEKIFSKFSKSIVFVQPQSGGSYTIDPVAKSVLLKILKDV